MALSEVTQYSPMNWISVDLNILNFAELIALQPPKYRPVTLDTSSDQQPGKLSDPLP